MSNPVQKFVSETFGTIRARLIDGDAWFVGKDVCKILDLGNVSQAVGRLDDDEKRLWESTPSKIYNTDNGRGRKRRPQLLVNEAGLYSLVLTSRTPAAKDFKRWVTHEVLPAIRRQGYWQSVRDGGKVTRRKFTDAIKEFCDYLQARGELDRPLGTWIIIFSKLVNKATGFDGERDDLTANELFELETCERIIMREMSRGMAAGKTHRDIFTNCESKLNG